MSARLDNLDERELVAKAKLGDDQAFGELIRRNRNFILAVVIKKYRYRREIADEAVQEASLLAWKKINLFDGREDASFAAWMIRIAERAGRKIGKKDSRYLADETLAVDELSPVRSIRPDWLCMAKEQVQQREQSMEVLTEIEDRFWRLHFEDGIPVPVIARECGVSIRKVRTVLARAEAWLKAHRQVYQRGNDGEFGEDGVDGKEADRGNDYDEGE